MIIKLVSKIQTANASHENVEKTEELPEASLSRKLKSYNNGKCLELREK